MTVTHPEAIVAAECCNLPQLHCLLANMGDESIRQLRDAAALLEGECYRTLLDRSHPHSHSVVNGVVHR